jgi:hypothetical protein
VCFLPFFGPRPPTESVESRSAYLYNGAAGLPGLWNNALVSTIFCSSATRLTLRCSDHATRPRQSRTLIAMNPSRAPTTMKTVPSGSLLRCIKGASAVGGTEGATITYPPVNVGNPETNAPTLVADEPVMTAPVACPVVLEPVITTPVDAVPVALLVPPDAVFTPPVVAVPVAWLERPLDDWAFEPAARRETAIVDARSRLLLHIFIVNRYVCKR